MNINWYPGHMNKARAQIKEKLGLVDLCCEIIDARIPYSSRNHMLEELTRTKPLLIIVNKSDMADPVETDRWIAALTGKGIMAMPFNAIKDKNTKSIYRAAVGLIADQLEKRRAKGIDKKEIRMMVFGIPNSGKSTFINNLSGRRSARVGNRPGVTTSQQWIKTDENLLLMDTPGILWQKFDPIQAYHLAYTGAIRDEVLELEELGFSLVRDLLKRDGAILRDRYGVDVDGEPIEVFDQIAKARGAIGRGGDIDYRRAAQILLDDFRKLRLGRISLEKVEDYEER